MTAIFGVLWLPCWIFYILYFIAPIRIFADLTYVLNQLSVFSLVLVLCCNQRVAGLWKARLARLGQMISRMALSTTNTGSPGSHPNGENIRQAADQIHKADNEHVHLQCKEIELGSLDKA